MDELGLDQNLEVLAEWVVCELYLKHLKKLFSFFFSPFKHTSVSLLAFHSEEVETSVQLLSCV